MRSLCAIGFSETFQIPNRELKLIKDRESIACLKQGHIMPRNGILYFFLNEESWTVVTNDRLVGRFKGRAQSASITAFRENSKPADFGGRTPFEGAKKDLLDVAIVKNSNSSSFWIGADSISALFNCLLHAKKK